MKLHCLNRTTTWRAAAPQAVSTKIGNRAFARPNAVRKQLQVLASAQSQTTTQTATTTQQKQYTCALLFEWVKTSKRIFAVVRSSIIPNALTQLLLLCCYAAVMA